MHTAPPLLSNTILRITFWLAVGLGLAQLINATASELLPRPAPTPAPVRVLEPAIQHADAKLTILQLAFEHRGSVSTCLLVLYRNERRDWTLKC